MFLKKVKCFDRLDKVSYETLSEETKNWNLEKNGMHLIIGSQAGSIKGLVFPKL
jgi:hypothetical protein